MKLGAPQRFGLAKLRRRRCPCAAWMGECSSMGHPKTSMSELLLFLASGLASLLQALLCAVGLLACLSVSLLWYTSRYPVKPMPHYTEPLVFAPEPDQPLLQGNDATQDFAHLIVRDFIRTWHNVLVQGETSQDALAFPMLIEDRISSCVNALFLRASTSDWLKFLMKHAMPTIVEHIRRFEQAELDTYGTQKTTAFHHKFDELLLASKYQGPLHPAVGTTSSLDSKVSELVYLRTLSERLLRALTPAHYTWTPTSMALVREVLSCSILYPVIDMASDPDWINEMVLQTLQHRLKRNLSAKSHSDKGHTMHSPPQTQGKTHPSRAVAGSQAKNGRKKYNKIEHTKSTSTDKWTSFRALLAATNSLLELHRIRDGLLLELDRRQSEEVRGTDQKNGKGKASSAGAIRRIQLALNLVQERVEQIEGKQVEPSPSDSVSSPLSPSRSTSVTLLDTLHDSVGLSNFIEFMERRNRSPLIQFWIFVNAFKDPLEQVDINVEAQLTEKSWKSTQGNQTTLMSADSDLLRDTIGTILAYYESPIFPVRQACRLIAEIASAYSTDLLFSEHQVYLIKQSVFLAQMDALDLMLEYDWGLFQDSLLFHQFFNHFRTLNAPPTHSPNAPEWDTDSNDSMADHVEANLLHDLLHDDRIPIQYGFLLGQGDGSRTKGNSLFRKPLFDQDPLFLEDTVSKDKQQSQDDTHSILLENSDQQSHSAHTILPRSVKTLSDTSLGEYRQYSMRITQLQDKLRNLKKQAELAEVMLSKAELAGSSADEIHVLEQSKDMIECDTTRIDREIQALRTRMIRYNRIFDPDPKQKVTVFINDTSLCQDEPGQPYILYIVTVQLCTPNAVNDEPIIRSWTVSRRYSAFRELHQALKKRFRAARMYDMMFPGRKFVGSTTSTYVETRRKALEKYLQVCVPKLTKACYFEFRDSNFSYHEAISFRRQFRSRPKNGRSDLV